MRLPESRFNIAPRTRRSRSAGRRVATVAVITVVTALLVGLVFLVIRMRTPIVPIAETRDTEDALELWNSKDYEGVIERTSVQLDEYPLDETALSLRGFSRFYLAVQMVETEQKQQLLIGAVRDLRRALLHEDPALAPEIHYVLGKTFFTMGSFFYDEAIRELEKARALGLDQLDLLEYLAIASENLRRYDDAVAYFEAAIARNNEAIHKVSLADLLIDLERYEYAEDLLSDAIDADPDNTLLQHAYLSRGRLYRAVGDYDAAVSEYESLLEINSSSAEAHFGLGETWLALGDNERARFEWREAIRLDPNHIESLQRLREY